MKIEYGPPGESGVKSLQYVSGPGDDADYVSAGIHQIAKPAGALALGTWAFAWATGRDKLKRTALGVSVASWLVYLFTRP